jgi:tetratricopeptide (TPR) repeat protein
MKHRVPLSTALLLLASCATQSIRVPVMKPAAVDLVQFERVAVDRFEGEGCDPFSDQLAAALGSATNPATGKPGFTVLHRKDIDRALDELRDRHGSEWDQRTMQILEKWRTAQIVVKGRMQRHDVERQEVKEKAKDTKGAEVQRRKEVLTAHVTVCLDATDVEGNRVFDRVTMNGEATACRYPDENKTAIDPLPLLQTARAQVVQAYMDRVLPHQEWVSVELFTDSDFPDLAVGNGYAEAGNWQQAQAAYQRALQGMTGPHQDVRHKGLFNLGVACEFSDRFDEARKALEEAYALGHDDLCLAELKRTGQREEEVRRLRQQGAAAQTQPVR